MLSVLTLSLYDVPVYFTVLTHVIVMKYCRLVGSQNVCWRMDRVCLCHVAGSV